jgi:hypothetical protein
MYGDKREVFGPLTPAALDRIREELAGTYGDQIAHQTAIWVLEQVYGKPTQTQVNRNEQASDAAQDVVQILHALAGAADSLSDAERKRLCANALADVVDVTGRPIAEAVG